MTVGRTLWKVIIIKMIIIFGVIKLFFFPDFLHTKFTNNKDRAAYVLEEITKPSNLHTINMEEKNDRKF